MHKHHRGVAIGANLCLAALLALSVGGQTAAQSDNQDQPPPKQQDQGRSDQHRSSHDDQDHRDDRGGSHVGVGVSLDVGRLFKRATSGHEPQKRISLYSVLLPSDPLGRRFHESDWMYAELKFSGHGLVGYLNLSVDGQWMVRNMPVIAQRDGEPESQWFGFRPGPVASRTGDVSVGYDVKPEIRHTAPTETFRALAPPREVFVCGMGGGPGSGTGGGPGAGGKGAKGGGELIGGQVIGKAHVHGGNFPNQKSEINQCVSVAFSNSLQWLNDTQNLKLDPNKISPAGLDKIVGRDPGKPIDYGAATKAKADKFKGSIDTYSGTADGISSVGDAIDKKCDVEMFTSPPNGGVGHAVAVTGISRVQTPKQGIKWSITIVEDAKQGPPTATDHNPISENVTYPTGNNQIGGGAGVDGKVISGFVVECKKGTDFSF
jgi:hypothetical protein